MRSRQLLAALIVVGIAITVVSCKQEFKQTVLAPEQIPVQMREHAEKRPNFNDPVWRAFYEQGGYEIAVASYVGGSTPWGAFPGWLWIVFEDGESVDNLGYLGFGGMGDYPYRRSEPFYWSPGEKLSSDGESGKSTYMIAAVGYAWDTRAFQVIATTTQGRTYEGKVVNGYWAVFDPDIGGIDRFETAIVQDQQGKVLHTYTRAD